MHDMNALPIARGAFPAQRVTLALSFVEHRAAIQDVPVKVGMTLGRRHETDRAVTMFVVVPAHESRDVVQKFVSAGMLECYVAFIEPIVASALPKTCCALTVTPLLRELVIRSADLPPMYERGGIESHLVTLLLDEIAVAPLGDLHLPMPTDPRLRALVEVMTTTPTDRSTMGTWARRVGMSERTMARALSNQTGMSSGRWRQQLHLMLAVQWLATGASVQRVADDLGYESASSFVSMYRKKLGAPPARYISERA